MPSTTRLAAMEVARVAQAGMSADRPPIQILTDDRLWFPTIADTLSDLRENMLASARESLAAILPDPAMRQRAELAIETADWSVHVASLAPTIADKVGLPVEAVQSAVVPYLSGQISSVEASRRMLSGISEPVVFVGMYFERWGPVGMLPNWIRDASLAVSRYLIALRDNIAKLRVVNDKKQVRLLISDFKPTFRQISFELARQSAAEFQLSDQSIDAIASDEALALAIPSAQIASAALEAYALQVVGVTAGGAKIEDSVGGDILHAFYLPYVDLWRGDRRFSAALRQALPAYRDRIGGPMAQLPREIELKLLSRSDA
jgi:hypothetical protein